MKIKTASLFYLVSGTETIYLTKQTHIQQMVVIPTDS